MKCVSLKHIAATRRTAFLDLVRVEEFEPATWSYAEMGRRAAGRSDAQIPETPRAELFSGVARIVPTVAGILSFIGTGIKAGV